MTFYGNAIDEESLICCWSFFVSYHAGIVCWIFWMESWGVTSDPESIHREG